MIINMTAPGMAPQQSTTKSKSPKPVDHEFIIKLKIKTEKPTEISQHDLMVNLLALYKRVDLWVPEDDQFYTVKSAEVIPVQEQRKIKIALKLVIELAQQNVLEPELHDEVQYCMRKEQLRAISRVSGLLRKL
jgi:hypothetical protein